MQQKTAKFYPVLSEKDKTFVESLAKGFSLQTPYEFAQFQELALCLAQGAEKAIASMNVLAVRNYTATVTAYSTLFNRIKEEKAKFDAEFDKDCVKLRKLIQSL
jgi:hypothetical protein